MDGHWQVLGPSCNYSCTTVLPVAGEFCQTFYPGTTCYVEACGGGRRPAFTCNEGVWEAVAPEEDEATCVANGCVWRGEACGGTLVGCYPTTCNQETKQITAGANCDEMVPVCGQPNIN